VIHVLILVLYKLFVYVFINFLPHFLIAVFYFLMLSYLFTSLLV